MVRCATVSLRETLTRLRPEAVEYKRLIDALPPEISSLQGQIRSLALHPIKSLGILNVRYARIGNDGLRTLEGTVADRMAMLVLKESGKTQRGVHYDAVRFSQRDEGMLALARPTYDGISGLTYHAPHMEQIDIEPEQFEARSGSESIRIRMFKKGDEMFDGVLEMGSITEWVRRFLRKNTAGGRYNIDDVCVVVRPSHFSRPVEERHRRDQDAQTLYTDGGQILTANAATLGWMNRSLAGQYGDLFRSIDMAAFRPNIELSGFPPNIEDFIDSVAIGKGKHAPRMLFGELSVRCDVTRVDPATGEKPDKEPLKWLKNNRPPRPDDPTSVTFAVNSVFPAEEAGKVIGVGDPVAILSEKP